MPHTATQKKVHQNTVTYTPPTRAYQDEEIEGQEETRLEETPQSQAEGKRACMSEDRKVECERKDVWCSVLW